MKRTTSIILFLCTQLFFIFFYIHVQSQKIRLSYQKQKYEKKKAELIEKKQALEQALHATHNLSTIKAYAVANNMLKIKLAQIKTIP